MSEMYTSDETPSSNTKPYLMVFSIDNPQGMRYSIDTGRLILGSSNIADIIVSDSLISEQHCSFQYIDGMVIVEDLQSQHGTYVHGTNITRYLVSSDTYVTCGATLIHLEFLNSIEQLCEDDLILFQKITSMRKSSEYIMRNINHYIIDISEYIHQSESDKNQYREYLAKAGKSLNSLRNFMRNISSFTKNLSTSSDQLNLRIVLKKTIDFITRNSSINIQYNIDDSLSPVNIDIGSINRIIQNIIRNAQEAISQDGTIIISAHNKKISSASSIPVSPGTYVCITIEDDGIGIQSDIRHQVLEPFFSTKKDHIGLGLSSVYFILKQLYGHISITSNKNAGTRITIYLPAVPVQETPDQKENTVMTSSYKGRILMMDDDIMVLSIIQKMLEEIGYTTITTSNGHETLSIYRTALKEQKPFDAVILDLTVYGSMNGQETMKKLLELDPHVRGIVSSGNPNSYIASHCNEFGFKKFLSKPYDINQLKEILYEVIQNTTDTIQSENISQ